MITALHIRPRREGAFAQLRLFLAAYLLYNVGRFVTVGDLGIATDHAHWIVDLENDLGVSAERSVQGMLDSGAVAWLMSNIYLAAQLVVLPGALIWLFRHSPARHRHRVGVRGSLAHREDALAALGPLVCLTVVATGNHYVFDMVAGLLVAGIGYLAGQLPARNAHRRLGLRRFRRPILARPQVT